MALIVFITGEKSRRGRNIFVRWEQSRQTRERFFHSSKPDYSIEQDFESKSHLSDSFLDGQDFTHLFSYHTPSVDSLHTLDKSFYITEISS